MKLRHFIVHAVVAIPLSGAGNWKSVSFNHIQANQVEYTAEGLVIKVDHSSSPLLYPLGATLKVKSFTAEIEITGELKIAGKKWPEDAYLRMGFVIPGDRHLGGMEKMFAAEWVKQLFALAPAKSGVDKIVFFNLAGDSKFVGKNRVMPKSKDLMQEFIVAARTPDTRIFSYKMENPILASALWLSSDGDDTGSAFTLRIRKLTLETEP